MTAQRARTLAVMLGVAAVVITADVISKALALRDLPGNPGVRLLGGLLTLRLTLNPGAAFGVGTSYTAVIALIACGVIVYVIRMAARLRSLAWTIALGLLLGGAAGNLGDRLFRGPGPLRGSVVDWLNLPHFPWTFNLADASITSAAVLIGILALWGIRIDGTSAAPPTTTGARPRRWPSSIISTWTWWPAPPPTSTASPNSRPCPSAPAPSAEPSVTNPERCALRLGSFRLACRGGRPGRGE
jgi:signal peptidase II